MINIHHGLLPSFKGKNPFQQAYDAGVKLIGATSHIVTEELDSGPIIEQLVDRVSHRDFPRSFRERSQSIEKQCLILSLQYYLEVRALAPFPHLVVFRFCGSFASRWCVRVLFTLSKVKPLAAMRAGSPDAVEQESSGRIERIRRLRKNVSRGCHLYWECAQETIPSTGRLP